MIGHLLRLVWNRKRSNALIALEILLSFIVLTAVTTLAVFYADNYRNPLGFAYANVWVISVDMHEGEGRISTTVETTGAGNDSARAAAAEEARRLRDERYGRLSQLLLALRDMPEVETAAMAAITPYSGNTWTSDIEAGGKRYRYGASAGTDELAHAMGLTLTRGRWFTKEDDAADWRPVVINQRLAREMFADKDPIGQFMTEERPAELSAPRMKVVGVITDFRKDGEYAAAENFVFSRLRLDGKGAEVEPAREIVIRVRPGTTAAFEERAMARLTAGAPEWTFQAEPLSQSRDTANRLRLAPLAAAAIVAVFLVLMVVMGLTGVLWLHVTQRTREIGLRRAKGATAVRIRRQLIGEVAVLTTIAVLVGVGIVIQFPLLRVFDVVRPAVYGVSIALSLALIFSLVTACAWVPSRLATTVEPAEALRYE